MSLLFAEKNTSLWLLDPSCFPSLLCCTFPELPAMLTLDCCLTLLLDHILDLYRFSTLDLGFSGMHCTCNPVIVDEYFGKRLMPPETETLAPEGPLWSMRNMKTGYTFLSPWELQCVCCSNHKLQVSLEPMHLLISYVNPNH